MIAEYGAGGLEPSVLRPPIGSKEVFRAMKLHAAWMSLLLIAFLGAMFATHSNAAVTADHQAVLLLPVD